MSRAPLEPARIDWSGPVPRAPAYDDLYHPAVGAFEQARHVFLTGNGLPARWRGRERFTVLETGFGLGLAFTATWQAWRDDAARCGRLEFVSIERHPPTRDDLARAHAASPGFARELVARWPPAVAGIHALDLDGGRVRLLLALGDIADVLPALHLQADAIFLDGFAPARNPAMWAAPVLKAVGRIAAPDATAATWSAARAVREGLVAAGFEVEVAAGIGGKRDTLRARFAPRWRMPARPSLAVAGPGDGAGQAGREGPRLGLGSPGSPGGTGRPGNARSPRSPDNAGGTDTTGSAARAHDVASGPNGHSRGRRAAVVVGAGIAGIEAAAALAAEGFEVTLIDRHDRPAAEASGNAGGLFHGGPPGAAADGPHARLLRLAALHAMRRYGPAIRRAAVGGGADGLLWLDRLPDPPPARDEPTGIARRVAADEASALAGVPLARGGWFIEQGGWLAPTDWAHEVLRTEARIRWCGGVEVERLEVPSCAGGRWRVIGRPAAPAAGAGGPGRVHDADAVVLANAGDATRLAAALGAVLPPLHRHRGQLSLLRGDGGRRPRLPICGDGYAVPLHDGTLLFGATRTAHDAGTELRPADHAFNLQRLRRLTGLDPATDAALLDGRAALRVQPPDRLPLAGPLLADTAAMDARAPLRRQPATPGLFVLAGLGSRGLTLAPLLARLVAAMAAGSAWPLEQDLVDAVDPRRAVWRAGRAGRAKRAAAR